MTCWETVAILQPCALLASSEPSRKTTRTSMEGEDILLQNIYWAKLNLDWDPYAVDLDQEEDNASLPAMENKKIVSSSWRCEAPASLPTTLRDCWNSPMSARYIQKRYESIEKICDYIDKTFKFCADFIKDNTKVSSSFDFEDISFDDDTPDEESSSSPRITENAKEYWLKNIPPPPPESPVAMSDDTGISDSECYDVFAAGASINSDNMLEFDYSAPTEYFMSMVDSTHYSSGLDEEMSSPSKREEKLWAKPEQPPENDLQKNLTDRVLSEHELRVQRSLQKLDLPDWYKNSPVPREGFLLKKRASDASSCAGWQQNGGLGTKTTSLGSLGGGGASAGSSLTRSPLALTPPAQHYNFTRWSTSRLNSQQTSPCSSARSSVRGGGVSPLTSPARPPRLPRPTRAPYLGWRSQERLASPRTPHERLAVSLLPQSPPVQANVSEEIQSSIKEVTSAIVHYVSGLPGQDQYEQKSPRSSPRLCWLESSFVGTKPLESPQTPVVVAQLSPPRDRQHLPPEVATSTPQHQQNGSPAHQQQRPLQLELSTTSRPTISATTYQHDWQSPQQSLLNLAITKPSPGSTTLEDVLDSLLGLPPSAPRTISPQNSPRRAASPYYVLGYQSSRVSERSGSRTSSIQLSVSSRTGGGEDAQSIEYRSVSGYSSLERPPSSAAGAGVAAALQDTTPPGSNGGDTEKGSISSLNYARSRARSATPTKRSSRRLSEPVLSQKSVSLDRRISYDSRASNTNNAEENSLSEALQQSKTSLKSIASINTDASGEDKLVHCQYTKCTSATTPTDAKKHYKSCHNCTYMYCSKECRRAHWEKHRKVCLHSRASALCRQILATAKEDQDSLHHVSTVAQKGYLAHGRGVVKAFFTSPDAAMRFTLNGFQSLGEPIYVKWPDLMPNEMGPELYAELVKLCKSYNPETRLVLYVAVCVVSEVPSKGGAVKWERQLVSRCAKLRLSKTVLGMVPPGTMPFHLSPKAKVRHREKDKSKPDTVETLILTSNSANIHHSSKIREISFNNIQTQLSMRGVNLKRHFPEVYTKLCAYVEGVCDKFAPMTIYPRDNVTGKSFMCVIMPETEPEKFQMLTKDTADCKTIDVSIDEDEQVSTPM